VRRDGASRKFDLPDVKSEYFFAEGLDKCEARGASDLPVGQSFGSLSCRSLISTIIDFIIVGRSWFLLRSSFACHHHAGLQAAPVNNPDKRPNPRIATLHCAIVKAPDSRGAFVYLFGENAWI
jgi:hypothetical protein